MENLTESTLGLCPDEENVCTGKILEYSTLGVNVFSVIVNIFHMLVLSRLQWLKRQAYYYILVHISVIDTASAVVMMFRSSCALNHLALNLPPLVGAVVSGLYDTFGLMRWYVVTFACVERYLAVCQTLRYSSYSLVTHIGKILTFLWIPALAMMLGRDIMFKDTVCIDPSLGVLNFTSMGPGIFSTFNLLVPTIVSFVTMTKTWRALRQMKLGIRKIDKGTKKSAIYIMTISAVFYICLLPASVYIIMMSFGYYSAKILRIPVTILYSLYGILNTLIYGWSVKSYRRAVSSMILRRHTIPEFTTPDPRAVNNRQQQLGYDIHGK